MRGRDQSERSAAPSNKISGKIATTVVQLLDSDMDLLEMWAIFGPGVAGAVFGAGWWFWVDAVVCSSVQVSFVHYLPGIFASFAALMFNCVRKEDIDYSPYDEGEWRLKLWLFFAYVVSFVSLAASVGLLIQDSIVKDGPSVWTGTAGVLQCVFVLISGLIYWTSHSE
ncbi:Transmembrane protein 50A [Linum grandiflorum]